MSIREFEEITVPYGDRGRWRKEARVTCAACGKHEQVNITLDNGYVHASQIKQKFEHRGWTIGKTAAQDYCSCIGTKANGNGHSVSKQLAASSIEVEGPRTMDRSDRQVIFQKLMEVYADETHGYTDGWSDQRVSTDLGVPRKWVETIREENFGSNAGSDQATQLLAQVDRIIAEARPWFEQLEAAKGKAEAFLAQPMVKELPVMKDRLIRLEREAAAIRKMVCP